MNFDPNNLEQIYNSLPPQQRQQVAEQFINKFKQSGTGQQFANVDPKNATPQQLAQMHEHARAQAPGVLGDVMKHPLVAAALGGFATYEVDKHVTGR